MKTLPPQDSILESPSHEKICGTYLFYCLFVLSSSQFRPQTGQTCQGSLDAHLHPLLAYQHVLGQSIYFKAEFTVSMVVYLYVGRRVQSWSALSSVEPLGQSCSENLTPSAVGRYMGSTQVKSADSPDTSEYGGYSVVLWVAAFHPMLIYPVLVPGGLAPYHIVQTTSIK